MYVLAALPAAGLSSDSEHTRCVVVGAVKYMVVDKPHPVDDLLKVRAEHWDACIRDYFFCSCTVSLVLSST